MPFETTDQVDAVMQGDQVQALWGEIRRLQGEFRNIFDLLSIPGGPGPVQVSAARLIAEKENNVRSSNSNAGT